jgi:hypothetical protein
MLHEKMTAINDKIRSILGITGKMGLDAMATNLETVLNHITDAFTAVSNKGGTVSESKVSGGLADAINSIPTNTGVTVQVKSGTVTGVSGSFKTVNVGFKPDAVFFTGTVPGAGTRIHAGVAFTAANATSRNTFFCGPSTSYAFSEFTVTQTSSGFKINGEKVDLSFDFTSESNRSLDYIAIKYTE